MRSFKIQTILIITALDLFTTNAWCFINVLIIDRTPFAYEKITVTNSEISMLDTTYRNSAGAIFLTVEDNPLRYRIDGGNATFSDGHLLSDSALQNLWLHDRYAIRNLRMIAIDGNASVHVTYYRVNR